MNTILKNTVLCFIFSFGVHAQSYNQLLQQKRSLIKESEEINIQLKETRFSTTHTIEELDILNKNIQLKEELLVVLNQELDILIKKENQLKVSLKSTMIEMEAVKTQYQELIKTAHQTSQRYNKILFFLASESFNQLIRRAYYFKQIETDRRNKFFKIKDLKLDIQTQQTSLREQKTKQIDLTVFQKQEITQLADLKTVKNSTLKHLSLKKDSLIAMLEQKQLQTKKISEAIILILEKEKNKNKDTSPELKLISKNFSSNKGSLPWPTLGGGVVSEFGETPHPVLAGITTMNNGIEISTRSKEIMSIFNGEVTKIIVLPNGLKVAIIRHGDYLTVYSNMHEINIKTGQKVKTKQVIGVLYEGEGPETKLLEFQIWKDRTKLNPRDWLVSY
jgi:murein DD-endopeptidase MepM/ murein hydrolase activator NlpD